MALRDTLNSIKNFVVSKKKKLDDFIPDIKGKDVVNFIKDVPKEIVAGVGRSAVIYDDTLKKVGDASSKLLLGKERRKAAQKRIDSENARRFNKLNSIKDFQLKEGEGFKNYFKDAANRALPEIRDSQNASLVQRVAAPLDLALTFMPGGAVKGTAKKGVVGVLSKLKEPVISGALGGASGAATMKDATAKDIIAGAGAGAVFGAGSKVAGDVVSKAPVVVKKVGNNIKTSLEEPKFQPGFYAGPKAKGYNEALVKNKTFKSPLDGNRKFEGDDSKARLNKVDITKEQDLVLDDVLDHDVLYKQYPELRDIQVKPDPVSSRSGAYDPKNNVLYLNPKEKDMKSVILHEVQHAIQKREGFPGGTSPVKYALPGDKERVRKAIETDNTDSIAREMDLYFNNIGEFEARDVQNRMNFTPKKRDKTTPYTSEKLDLTLANSSPDDIINNNIKSKNVITTVNPTGSVFTDYNPNSRANARLADNIVTLDKTMEKNPEDLITIYRGVPKGAQREIVPGDFITTNKQLAKDYAGDGDVIEKQVKLKDVLDDTTEPLGEEYLYKPNQKDDTIDKDTINSSYEKRRGEKPNESRYANTGESGSMGVGEVKTDAQRNARGAGKESPEEVAQRILAKIKDADEPFVTPKELEKRKSTELFPDLPKTEDVRKAQRNDEARAMLDEVLQKDPSYREKLLLNKIPPIEKIQGLGKNNAYDPNVDIRGERLKLSGKALDMSNKQLREQVAFTKSLNKEPITPKKFDNFFNEWIGKRQSSEAKGIKEALKFKNIPEDKAWEIVRSIESGTPIYEVNPEIQDTIRSLREAFNIAREQGVSAGVDIGYLDNYITHIWEEPTQEVIAAFDRAKQRFKYSKERNIMTYDEGLKLGLTPKYNNPNQILGEYVKNLNSSIADIQFINGLKDNDLLVEDRSLAQPGWLEFSFPGLVGGQIFWAPEKIGNTLKKVLDTPPGDAFTNTVGALAKTSGVIQDIALSGGVPTLPINAFTLGQSIKELAGLRILAPLQAGWRAFSDKSAKKYFQNNIDSIIQMQEQGIPVSPNINIPNLNKSALKEWFGDGLTKDKREKVAAIWSASINDPTFKRFMPIMQVQFYNDTKAWFKMRGRSDIEAQRIAGEATKAWYGVIPTYDKVRRTQISDDFVSTVMFAPKYRESMIRFWYSIPRSVTDKLLDPAYETSRKFLIGASLMYIGYNALNKEETGKDMWDNPTNDKWNVIMKKPGGAEGDYIKIPFLPSVATIPRALYSMGELGYKGDFAGVAQEGFQKFSSMLIKPFADAVRNKDYFENEIYDESASPGEKLSKSAQYIAGQYMPSAVRIAGQTPIGNDIAQKFGLGMSDEEFAQKKKDWVQLGLEGIEAPVRFTNKKKIDGAYYFDSKDEVLSSLTPEERDIFKALHPKNKLNIQEMDDEYLPISEKQKKISEYQMKLANPNILEAETQIAKKTSEKTGQPLDPLYALTPGQQRIVLTYQSIIPGEDEKSTMIQSNPWIKDYWKKRSAFFDTISPNKNKEENVYTYDGIAPLAPRDIWLSKPIIATDDLQAKLDTYFSLPDKSDEKKAYIDNHPELSNYLEAKAISNNLQRLAMGIPLKEDAYSKYAKGSGKKLTELEKKQKRETKKNLLKLSKIKTAEQIKVKNTPTIKLARLNNTASNKPIIKLNKTRTTTPKKIAFNSIQIKKK